MNVQLARYLKDFSAPPRPKPAFFQPPGFHAGAPDAGAEHFAVPPAAPAVDVAAERAEAFADGRAEAEAELSARHAGELEALRETHAAALDALKAKYEADYAAALARRFSTLSAEVSDLVASQAAEVLAPVLDEALTRKAVADLAAVIAEGLRDGEAVTITVKGPAALFEGLKAHFAGEAPVFRHVEMQDVDLTVEFGETVLVTRMAAWADTVRKVLA